MKCVAGKLVYIEDIWNQAAENCLFATVCEIALLQIAVTQAIQTYDTVFYHSFYARLELVISIQSSIHSTFVIEAMCLIVTCNWSHWLISGDVYLVQNTIVS